MKQALYLKHASDHAITENNRGGKRNQKKKKAIKALMHVISAQHILKWCTTSINIRPKLFEETLLIKLSTDFHKTLVFNRGTQARNLPLTKGLV